MVCLLLSLAFLLQATAIHGHPILHKGRVGRQLLPPLFHASTGQSSFGTHLAQGGLYVCCSLPVQFASGLGLSFFSGLLPNKLFPLCWCDVPVICEWRSALLDIPCIQFTLPLAECFTQHLQSITPNLFSSSSGQNKCSAQQLPHRFFSPLRNQGPTWDRWIQNHLCPYYSTDSIPKLCNNLRKFYRLSCRANCINSKLRFGVLVSALLTRFLLLCTSEDVLAGSGPELSLSSSVGLGAWRRRLPLPAGASMDHDSSSPNA